MAQSERILLRRYVDGRDADAFRGLVERHRNMVFATCRRILGNSADAEDAAQECFLHFVRQARGLKAPIGGWLHKVAVRAAIDLRRQKKSRAERETAAAKDKGAAREPSWDDVKHAVDEAICALPEGLRLPTVLYYLEGRTQEEIAEELGIDDSTVSRRLARGAEALRKHLRKAGWLASVAALSALLSAHGAEASPATLNASLGKMALAGGAAVTPSSAAISGAGILGGMSMLKVSIITLVTAGALGVGGVVVRETMNQKGAVPQAVPVAAIAVPQPAEPATTGLHGVVLTPDGKPAAGATVKLYYLHDDSGYGSKWLTETKADAQGRFAMSSPEIDAPHVSLLIGRLKVRRRFLVAYQAGFAPAIAEVDPSGEATDYSLTLAKGRDVPCTVLDKDGAPVEGAVVYVFHVSDPSGDLRLLELSEEVMSCVASEAFGKRATDAHGSAVLRDVPTSALDIRAYHLEKGLGWETISGPMTGTRAFSIFRAFAGSESSQTTIRLTNKIMPLAGEVVAADTGRPVPGMIVLGEAIQPGFCPPLWWSTTDAEGKFQLMAFEGTGRWKTVAAFDPSPRPEYVSAKVGWQTRTAAGRPVVVRMERGASVKVSVHNAQTGTVASGAVLGFPLFGEGVSVRESRACDAAGDCNFCVDASRTIEVEDPPPGNAFVALPGMAEVQFAEKDSQYDVLANFSPCRDIPATVRLPDGRGAGDVAVAIQLAGVRPSDKSYAQTDSSGRAMLRGLPLDRDVTIYCCSPLNGRSSAARLDWHVKPDPKPIEITLKDVPTTEVVLLDDNGNGVSASANWVGRRAVDITLPDGPVIAWANGASREGRAVAFVSGLLPDADYQVWTAGIQLGETTTQRTDFFPAGPLHLGKDDKNPKFVLTYDPKHLRSRPQAPKPRTEEDFKRDCSALAAKWSKQDPVEKNLGWYGLKTGLARADSVSKKVESITELLGEKGFVASGIAFGKDKVWLGTNKGLFVWDRKDMFWTRFAVGGTAVDAPVSELTLVSDHKLVVTIGAPDTGLSKYEYDIGEQKWNRLK